MKTRAVSLLAVSVLVLAGCAPELADPAPSASATSAPAPSGSASPSAEKVNALYGGDCDAVFAGESVADLTGGEVIASRREFGWMPAAESIGGLSCSWQITREDETTYIEMIAVPLSEVDDDLRADFSDLSCAQVDEAPTCSVSGVASSAWLLFEGYGDSAEPREMLTSLATHAQRSHPGALTAATRSESELPDCDDLLSEADLARFLPRLAVPTGDAPRSPIAVALDDVGAAQSCTYEGAGDAALHLTYVPHGGRIDAWNDMTTVWENVLATDTFGYSVSPADVSGAADAQAVVLDGPTSPVLLISVDDQGNVLEVVTEGPDADVAGIAGAVLGARD